jgi:hypothetical protein
LHSRQHFFTEHYFVEHLVWVVSLIALGPLIFVVLIEAVKFADHFSGTNLDDCLLSLLVLSLLSSFFALIGVLFLSTAFSLIFFLLRFFFVFKALFLLLFRRERLSKIFAFMVLLYFFRWLAGVLLFELLDPLLALADLLLYDIVFFG